MGHIQWADLRHGADIRLATLSLCGVHLLLVRCLCFLLPDGIRRSGLCCGPQGVAPWSLFQMNALQHSIDRMAVRSLCFDCVWHAGLAGRLGGWVSSGERCCGLPASLSDAFRLELFCSLFILGVPGFGGDSSRLNIIWTHLKGADKQRVSWMSEREARKKQKYPMGSPSRQAHTSVRRPANEGHAKKIKQVQCCL